jgi:hypothetical protein
MAEAEEIKARQGPAMQELGRLFQEKGIHFCFIGGMAVLEHGFDYFTSDIDALILLDDRAHFAELVGVFFRPAFSGAQKQFILNESNLRFEVIFSGEISGDGRRGLLYLPPAQVSETRSGLPFLTLEHLIAYKLSAGLYAPGRLKDFAAVQELIKANALPRDFARAMRADVKTKYEEIWDATY